MKYNTYKKSMKYDGRRKSMLKSIVWRILGIIILAIITYAKTRSWIQTSLITILHHGCFIIIFYLHERVWLKTDLKPKVKHIFKAITYEIVLGNLVLGTITYLITGNWQKVAGITLTYIVIKLFIYPFYDYFWTKKTTVYAYVVADILNVGHIRHLYRAKQQGDYLIVGVLTDKATMEKKPKPTIPAPERFVTIKALKMVDKVIWQTEYSPLNNVKKIRPDVLMESDSHEQQPANDFVKSYGGKVIVTPYYEKQSSTLIKFKIINQWLNRNAQNKLQKK